MGAHGKSAADFSCTEWQFRSDAILSVLLAISRTTLQSPVTTRLFQYPHGQRLPQICQRQRNMSSDVGVLPASHLDRLCRHTLVMLEGWSDITLSSSVWVHGYPRLGCGCKLRSTYVKCLKVKQKSIIIIKVCKNVNVKQARVWWLGLLEKSEEDTRNIVLCHCRTNEVMPVCTTNCKNH